MELIKVDKSLGKRGLHRDLITNVTFRMESLEEMKNCSFVFVENLTADMYVYVEELKKVNGFEFWPNYSMEIEKPAKYS